MQSRTPMMHQYLSIKEQYSDEILFYRMGDFYEMFFEDAVEGAKILGIALTKRGKQDGIDVPMCGVPVHSCAQYLERLVKSGRKIAICEQIETPQEAKKRGYKEVVRREVTRIITSGTILEDTLVNCDQSNYLCSVYKVKSGVNSLFYLAFADIGTKEVFFIESSFSNFRNELAKISPREVLISDKLYLEYKTNGKLKGYLKEFEGLISTRSDSIFNLARCNRRLLDFYQIIDLGMVEGLEDGAIIALGVLVEYLEHTQKQNLKMLKMPKSLNLLEYMSIDSSTLYNLEVIDNSKAENFTLLNAINSTQTSMGSRLLRSWVVRPLRDRELIERRLDNVEFLLKHSDLHKILHDVLSKFPDLERLIAKVFYKRCGPKDIKAIQSALECLEFINKQVIQLKSRIGDLCPILNSVLIDSSGFRKLISILHQSIIADPSASVMQGGFVKYGYSAKLDNMLNFKQEIDNKLKNLKEKYIEISSVSNLKISSNNLIGYYIEVSQQNADSMNSAIFKHRQSLANSIRFTTDELLELQEKIIHIDEQILELELSIFTEICDKILANSEHIEIASATIAQLDVYLCAAKNAYRFNHIRPQIVDESVIEIKGGKHPIMEIYDSEIVDNDLSLDKHDKIWLITGPNMAGKSTFLRQNALIIILSQIGFFVPASSAKIGVADKIFSRIGASDNTARGQSTFMVEMLEASYILNNATTNSLIIFDEIGRGTSTYDGLSLAWAILEHVHNTICARTLFATHYHELKELASQLSFLSIHTPKIEDYEGNIFFKYKIEPGSAKGSYGIHVAELAGMPKGILKRANNILSQFESDPVLKLPSITSPIVETNAVNDNEKHVLEVLKAIDINQITPINALEMIQNMQKELEQV